MREDFEAAIDSFTKAVQLCSLYKEGNLRVQSSTLFTIGTCYEFLKLSNEAK